MGKRSNINKELVHLREKKLKDGSTSLYLDAYVNGVRIRDFLQIYLVKATTAAEKEQNMRNYATAQTLRIKKEQQLMKEMKAKKYGYATESSSFLNYFRRCAEERHGDINSGTWGPWRGAMRYLERYADENTTFQDITPEWIYGFKEYLDIAEKETHKTKRVKEHTYARLSQNSKYSYFNKLKACLHEAYREHVILFNPVDGMDGFKEEETERCYLTWNEVEKLFSTPCANETLKRAFLFSCLTGLRKSDIINLKWSDVVEEGGYTRIIFRQQKTGGQEYLDINEQAVSLLGKRSNPYDHPFAGFKYSVTTLLELKRWALSAGIQKEPTFHSARHSFAVCMLDFGTDIYTVSKLLGHRNITTTQVYAKVLDKNKRLAVSRFPKINTLK